MVMSPNGPNFIPFHNHTSSISPLAKVLTSKFADGAHRLAVVGERETEEEGVVDVGEEGVSEEGVSEEGFGEEGVMQTDVEVDQDGDVEGLDDGNDDSQVKEQLDLMARSWTGLVGCVEYQYYQIPLSPFSFGPVPSS